MEQTYKISDLPATMGIQSPLVLTGNPLKKHKYRVHVLALGDVGTTILMGLRLLGAEVIQSIGISDLNEKNIERLVMEMNQIRYPFAQWPEAAMSVLPPVYAVPEGKLFDCDVFIFCASKSVPAIGVQGDVRMVQLEANSALASHFARMAKDAHFSGLICEVSDPVDPLAKVFLRESGLAPEQIQGYGLGVMNARACYYAEKDPALTHYLTEGRAFGPHGEDLVIADSLENYDEAKSEKLTRLTVEANLAVRALGYKPYIAPALSSAALSILLTLQGKWHYGSVYLGDADKGAYFGVRNRYTAAGLAYEDVTVGPALFARLQRAYGNLCKLS